MLKDIPLQRQNGVAGRDYHRPYLSKEKSKKAANRRAKAESERRKKINSQLSTLRELFPHLPKKDKSRVLTEAVKRLRELRKKVADQLAQLQKEDETGSSTPLFLPGENDEVAVVPHTGGEGDATVKATICCEDRPGLNRDLKEAVQSVKGRVVKAEMATVGGRTKVDVVVRWYKEQGGDGCGGGGEKDLGLLRLALEAVVENRPLGLQFEKWAGLKWESFVNKSAQICGSLSNDTGRPMKTD